MFEKFRNRREEARGTEEYDSFAATFGERLDVQSLLYIRDMEDFFIDGNLMTEAERKPVPSYLQDEWREITGGPGEPLRQRDLG